MTNPRLDELIRDLTKTMPAPVAKSYARKLVVAFLAAEFEALRQEVEGMRKKEGADNVYYGIWGEGFNQALDKVLELIRKRRGD